MSTRSRLPVDNSITRREAPPRRRAQRQGCITRAVIGLGPTFSSQALSSSAARQRDSAGGVSLATTRAKPGVRKYLASQLSSSRRRVHRACAGWAWVVRTNSNALCTSPAQVPRPCFRPRADVLVTTLVLVGSGGRVSLATTGAKPGVGKYLASQLS